ncbi:MAG TPA: sigma-70 family RNA polymerase sigma factor, partial [Phycisphaerae bacterium]
EISREMAAAIGKLPADYAKVVRMYDLEGRSVAEVAAAVGRSEGAVYMLRSRAHDRLRELLASASRFMSTPG